ncbi:MAG: hypothetical protein K6E63_06440 [Lachnospiraceae bacterium]|nr:hypothetical protein [Lachnospiraceae bacterium]
MNDILLNSALIVFETAGLYLSIKNRGVKIVRYYTQISNIIAMLSSVLYLAMGRYAAPFRYTAVCMLTMTFFVTVFVLIPMGGGFKKLMLEGNGLYHHTICPILCFVSYVFFEPHASVWYVPVIITAVYGTVMLILNYKKVVDGPYPFLKVHEQGKKASVMWMTVLTLVIMGIALLFSFFVK